MLFAKTIQKLRILARVLNAADAWADAERGLHYCNFSSITDFEKAALADDRARQALLNAVEAAHDAKLDLGKLNFWS